MANTLVSVKRYENGHIYHFNISSSAAPDLLQLPVGCNIRGLTMPVFTSATARTATGAAYVVATGVLTISGVTASDAYDVCVIGD